MDVDGEIMVSRRKLTGGNGKQYESVGDAKAEADRARDRETQTETDKKSDRGTLPR